MKTLIATNFNDFDLNRDLFVTDQLDGYAWSYEKVRVLDPSSGKYFYGTVSAISFSRDAPIWHVRPHSKILGGWEYEQDT